MDAETDTLIQETIRSSFQDCTTLTIAHRLHTVLASDRIMVLNQGQVLYHTDQLVDQLVQVKELIYFTCFTYLSRTYSLD